MYLEDLEDNVFILIETSQKCRLSLPCMVLLTFLLVSSSFRCTKCRRWWISGHVHILFQLKLNWLDGQGLVKMRIFRQECKRCSTGCLEDPTFTPEVIDNVVGKLMRRIRKTCYGELGADDHDLSSITYGRREGPHEKQHCEACRQGICDWRVSNQDPPGAPAPWQSVASPPLVAPIEEMQSGIHSLSNTTNPLGPTLLDNASNLGNPEASWVIPASNALYGVDPGPAWNNTTYRADPGAIWEIPPDNATYGTDPPTVWQTPPDYATNMVQPSSPQDLSTHNAAFGVASESFREIAGPFNAAYGLFWETPSDSASDNLEHTSPVLALRPDNASDGVNLKHVSAKPPRPKGAFLRWTVLVFGVGSMLWWLFRRFRDRPEPPRPQVVPAVRLHHTHDLLLLLQGI
ncbi:uncharacterized protein LOC144791084 isoform X2 [Lissotriton helveticus]